MIHQCKSSEVWNNTKIKYLKRMTKVCPFLGWLLWSVKRLDDSYSQNPKLTDTELV